MTRPALTPAVVAAAAVGGAVGALARWAVSEAAPVAPGTFPWSTFAINVAGALLLGALPAVAAVRRHRAIAVLLGTGVLGGFTTLSAFAEEGRALIERGHLALAATYLVGTVLAGVAAARLGHLVSTPAAQRELVDEDAVE